MRALGIDFGERRIGLAISDPDGRVAVPLATLERSSDRAAVREIAAIIRREGVERLVFGEPRELDGQPGKLHERVARFATRLGSATGLPLEWVDESLTSVSAEAQLREAGVDIRRHRERVDAQAAQILLQEALERHRAD
jgi:putative Holliday junction resolvase